MRRMASAAPDLAIPTVEAAVATRPVDRCRNDHSVCAGAALPQKIGLWEASRRRSRFASRNRSVSSRSETSPTFFLGKARFGADG